MPRVVAGTGVKPAIAAIVNRHLAGLDADALKSRRDCVDQAREDSSSADFTRTAEVTMRGPRFLSVTDTYEYYCGGAHPDNDFSAVVYDLQTGHSVNWLAYLPKGARADGGFVVWEPLHRMLVESADKDCKEVMTDNTSGYTLYLTAKGKLMVQPGQSSHATQNCDDPLELDVAAARKLGVAPALLEVMAAVKTTQQ